MIEKPIIKTLINTSTAVVYIFAVSQIMQNGSRLFGEEDNFFMPFVILLLFSLSATIVAGLVLGDSVILFLNKKNKEGLQSDIYSIGWLGAYTIMGILILLLIK